MDQKALTSMLVVGLAAGLLASFIVGGSRWGLIGSLIAGVVGSFIGGPALSALGVNLGIGNPLVARIVTSTIGAIIVVILARIIG